MSDEQTIRVHPNNARGIRWALDRLAALGGGHIHVDPTADPNEDPGGDGGSGGSVMGGGPSGPKGGGG